MPRMRWRPAGGAHDAPPDPLVGWGRGGGRHPLPRTPRLSALRFSRFQRSARTARRHVFSVNFGNTPLIASIVISLSRGCLPNDEVTGPQIFFPRTATGFLHYSGKDWCDGDRTIIGMLLGI